MSSAASKLRALLAADGDAVTIPLTGRAVIHTAPRSTARSLTIDLSPELMHAIKQAEKERAAGPPQQDQWTAVSGEGAADASTTAPHESSALHAGDDEDDVVAPGEVAAGPEPVDDWELLADDEEASAAAVAKVAEAAHAAGEERAAGLWSTARMRPLSDTTLPVLLVNLAAFAADTDIGLEVCAEAVANKLVQGTQADVSQLLASGYAVHADTATALGVLPVLQKAQSDSTWMALVYPEFHPGLEQLDSEDEGDDLAMADTLAIERRVAALAWHDVWAAMQCPVPAVAGAATAIAAASLPVAWKQGAVRTLLQWAQEAGLDVSPLSSETRDAAVHAAVAGMFQPGVPKPDTLPPIPASAPLSRLLATALAAVRAWPLQSADVQAAAAAAAAAQRDGEVPDVQPSQPDTAAVEFECYQHDSHVLCQAQPGILPVTPSLYCLDADEPEPPEANEVPRLASSACLAAVFPADTVSSMAARADKTMDVAAAVHGHLLWAWADAVGPVPGCTLPVDAPASTSAAAATSPAKLSKSSKKHKKRKQKRKAPSAAEAAGEAAAQAVLAERRTAARAVPGAHAATIREARAAKREAKAVAKAEARAAAEDAAYAARAPPRLAVTGGLAALAASRDAGDDDLFW